MPLAMSGQSDQLHPDDKAEFDVARGFLSKRAR
jgi:hypothetical protein